MTCDSFGMAREVIGEIEGRNVMGGEEGSGQEKVVVIGGRRMEWFIALYVLEGNKEVQRQRGKQARRQASKEVRKQVIE